MSTPLTRPVASTQRRRPPWLVPPELVAAAARAEHGDEPGAAELGQAELGEVGSLAGSLVGGPVAEGTVVQVARRWWRDRAVLAPALLATWTGAAVIVWGALAGALTGLLVASGVMTPTDTTRALVHVNGTPGLRPWHLLAGTLAGAGGGARATAQSLFGSLWWVPAWVAAATGGALAATVLAALAEGRSLERRYRAPTMAELRRLAVALQRAGSHLGAAGTPSLLIVEHGSPLARAGVRRVVLSTGLLESLDDDALAAVLAHAIAHVHAGDGLRRLGVRMAAWPLLVAAGCAGLPRRPSPGRTGRAMRTVTRFACGPARLVVRGVIGKVLEPLEHRCEEVADDDVARAGLGDSLVAAWDRIGVVAVASLCSASLGARPLPLAVRADRLRDRRPLDPFFADHRSGGPSRSVGGDGRLLVAALVVVALAAGVVLDAGAAAATRRAALDTGAGFTVAYLDAGLDVAASRHVVAASVPASALGGAEQAAAQATLGVAAGLAAGRPTTSAAHAIGCRRLDASSGSSSSTVEVVARWDYSALGRAHRAWVTSTVRLRLSGSRWLPVSAPQIALSGASRSGPSLPRCP